MSQPGKMKDLETQIMLLKMKMGELQEQLVGITKRLDRQKRGLHELWHYLYSITIKR